MDDIVKAALKKWPNVPHCYGWLALDARGDWYLRDDSIQAAGPFPQVKGDRIHHLKFKEFIQRNYDRDERGAWFFQNGPQRVYVQLEAAPLVLGVRRLNEAGEGGFEVTTHTGQVVQHVSASWLDEMGRLFLATDLGLGLVRSLDMDVAADALEAGLWGEPQEELFARLPERFHYSLTPQP
ncbi:MAG: DUF2946 family protein [Burkholderiales bacterium]|nr:DUF2946 family protein [Burkholderiales bacterium]